MPIHTCSSRDLAAKVAELESSSERITQLVAANDDTFIVLTHIPNVKRGSGMETR